MQRPESSGVGGRAGDPESPGTADQALPPSLANRCLLVCRSGGAPGWHPGPGGRGALLPGTPHADLGYDGEARGSPRPGQALHELPKSRARLVARSRPAPPGTCVGVSTWPSESTAAPEYCTCSAPCGASSTSCKLNGPLHWLTSAGMAADGDGWRPRTTTEPDQSRWAVAAAYTHASAGAPPHSPELHQSALEFASHASRFGPIGWRGAVSR